jgi:hypothetical protein
MTIWATSLISIEGKKCFPSPVPLKSLFVQRGDLINQNSEKQQGVYRML